MGRRAGFWIRAVAAGLDAAAAFALSIVLAPSVGIFFARRAVVTLRIGEPGTLWRGPVPLMIGIFGEVFYLLPLTISLVWLLDPLTGACDARAQDAETDAQPGCGCAPRARSRRSGPVRPAVPAAVQIRVIWGRASKC